MPQYDQYVSSESSKLERGVAKANGHFAYGSTGHDKQEKDSLVTASSSPTNQGDNDNYDEDAEFKTLRRRKIMTRYLDALTKLPLRRVALEVSLYVNLFITLAKLVAYIQTLSLSVLAALLDSVLDVVSQFVLNYTEKHSSLQRSSAFYPAGASRLEPIGVLTCAALMVRKCLFTSLEGFVSPLNGASHRRIIIIGIGHGIL
jgi:hypothetical protein